MEYRILSRASNDISDIIAYSEKNYGNESAARYAALIRLAIRAVVDDPDRIGSRPVNGRAGVKTFSLKLARSMLVGADRGGEAPHKVVYRAVDDIVEIMGVVGEGYPGERVR